ncbi:DUF2188 domain-containing protein [Sphingomonas segetis]|jgi:hypothetical protein|uniref:DUF2188 domain-containing protein n=1 Tax=Sphingomonas segetis TaxID=1104779 RepID=UPI0012D2C85C|nr:DUF2188 domain-containing protein [Sphingomonas segetis]
MAKGKLPRFDLTKDEKRDQWVLKEHGADRAKARFDTKSEATAGGVLGKAVGPGGGSVRIHKEDGKIQEERTFPGSKDPKSSPG